MFRSASLFIGTSFTVVVFTIFATSNVDSIVGIDNKIYSMQRILIHIKADLFVKCAHLHPGYAANLVARSRFYHCHWTLLVQHRFTKCVCPPRRTLRILLLINYRSTNVVLEILTIGISVTRHNSRMQYDLFVAPPLHVIRCSIPLWPSPT